MENIYCLKQMLLIDRREVSNDFIGIVKTSKLMLAANT